MAPMEDLLGPLLVSGEADSKPKPTSDVLKGAELVALYFSASWCPPCRAFTPLLIDFYNASGRANGLRVVFVSSDRDATSFRDYFGKMPWAAIPMDGDSSASVRQELSSKLHIRGIPALVVLDAETGNFVTDGARDEVMGVGGDPQRGKEVVEGWKGKESVPIEEAAFGHGREPFGLGTIISHLLRNPLWIFALLYFFKRIVAWLQELGAEEEEGGGKEL